MEPQPQRLHQQVQTASRLAAMGPGLTEEVLLQAVQFGQDEAAQTTSNDVLTMTGFLAWGKPLRSLREQLAPHGSARPQP